MGHGDFLIDGSGLHPAGRKGGVLFFSNQFSLPNLDAGHGTFSNQKLSATIKKLRTTVLEPSKCTE